MNATNITNITGEGEMEMEANVSLGETYAMIAIMTVLSIVGAVGNGLVIYVFYKKQDRLISTFFIITLGIVDFFTCLIVIPFTTYMEYVDYEMSYDFPCKLYYFLITCNIPLSILIMVAIAIDRYFCICHPFMNALNMARAKIMTACMGLFAAALGIVVLLQHGIVYDSSSIESVDSFNATVQQALSQNKTDESLQPEDLQLVGYCDQFSASQDFLWYYQKFYFAMFFICLAIVIVLYSLIYYSVHARRSARARQRSTALLLVQNTNGGEPVDTQVTHLQPPERDATNGHNNRATTRNPTLGGSALGGSRRRSTMRNADRIANIKTALMLFVVTVVFVVTYVPAMLMALQAITYVRLVFYMYFANNVANPIIYGFMNKNFRDDLHRIFCWNRS